MLLNTRQDRPTNHGHDGAFSARCEDCREAWINDAAHDAVIHTRSLIDARARAEQAFDEIFDTDD